MYKMVSILLATSLFFANGQVKIKTLKESPTIVEQKFEQDNSIKAVGVNSSGSFETGRFINRLNTAQIYQKQDKEAPNYNSEENLNKRHAIKENYKSYIAKDGTKNQKFELFEKSKLQHPLQLVPCFEYFFYHVSKSTSPLQKIQSGSSLDSEAK